MEETKQKGHKTDRTMISLIVNLDNWMHHSILLYEKVLNNSHNTGI